MTKQEKLIARYERMLEKVKEQYGTDSKSGRVIDNNAYIQFAEKELEEVRNGREW